MKCPKCVGRQTDSVFCNGCEHYLSLFEGATAKQLFETCNELASNPELRKRLEEEISEGLPDGYSFEITPAGFGRLHCPLFVTSIEEKLDRDKNKD